MIRQKVTAVIQWLGRVVTQPLDELNRWQKAIRFGYDLVRFGTRQLRRDRAQQMAAALSFRTLFGLLPVFVVAMVLVKAMDMDTWFDEPLSRLFQFAGLDQVTIVPPTEVEQAPQTLDLWMQDRVHEAGQVNLAAVGWVGLTVMTYAAIGLLVTIENCFNTIYHAPEGRPWTRRVPLYWFLLTSSPLAVMLSTSINSQFDSSVQSLHMPVWLMHLSAGAWSVMVVWLFMFLVYTLFPNTHVAIRPALVGSLVAAILLELGKRSLGVFLKDGLSISQLYGSLGLIPLFMFWVYLMWLAILFGLEVSAVLQMLGGRDLKEIMTQRRATWMIDPSAVLGVMSTIGKRFEEGQTSTLRVVAETLALPENLTQQIIDELIEAEMLVRVDGSEMTVTLTRSPDHMLAGDLLRIGFTMADRGSDSRQTQLEKQFRQTQLDLVQEKSLAQFLS